MCLNKHSRVSNRGRVNNYGGGNTLIKTGARMD